MPIITTGDLRSYDSHILLVITYVGADTLLLSLSIGQYGCCSDMATMRH